MGPQQQPEDPFVDSPSPQPIPLNNESAGHKIAAISRSLASLGVSLRTAVPAPTRQSQEGMLQILDSIENLIQELSREGGGSIQTPAIGDISTVHQRPTLSAAVNILVKDHLCI
jgi:hypothetical protein